MWLSASSPPWCGTGSPPPVDPRCVWPVYRSWMVVLGWESAGVGLASLPFCREVFLCGSEEHILAGEGIVSVQCTLVAGVLCVWSRRRCTLTPCVYIILFARGCWGGGLHDALGLPSPTPVCGHGGGSDVRLFLLPLPHWPLAAVGSHGSGCAPHVYIMCLNPIVVCTW